MAILTVIHITATTTIFTAGGAGPDQAGTGIDIIGITITTVIVEKGVRGMDKHTGQPPRVIGVSVVIFGLIYFLLSIFIVLSIVGCAVRQGATPQQVAGRTIGGATVGAAAGAIGGATVGQPGAGAAAGATAGGLLGFLSSLFQVNVYDHGTPYGGGYTAPSYGGRSYTPEEACSSFENPAEQQLCEEEYRKGAEEERQRVERQIEQDSCRIAREKVRYTGTIPEEYCTNVHTELWQQDACKRGMARCAPRAYQQRERDIRRFGREASRGAYP